MAISTDKVIEECNDLIRFDYDAIGAYDQAIDALKDPQLSQPLTSFRGDHQRHVTDLGSLVRKLGGTPPDAPGARGFIRKAMTKVAGLVGPEATLKAMKSNEEAINKAYNFHTTLDLPADVLELVKKNYEDEKRHLQWVTDALRTRIWEQPGAHP